ncbi:hypothetical protein OMD49_00725 [Bacillus anthracis]|nr:hypothetical protein [Bacillus anthracis]
MKTNEVYPKLTNEQIDSLMYKKWFGTIVESLVGLVEKSLKAELNTLKCWIIVILIHCQQLMRKVEV